MLFKEERKKNTLLKTILFVISIGYSPFDFSQLFSHLPVLLCPPKGCTLGCNPWLPYLLLMLLFGQ